MQHTDAASSSSIELRLKHRVPDTRAQYCTQQITERTTSRRQYRAHAYFSTGQGTETVLRQYCDGDTAVPHRPPSSVLRRSPIAQY
eukprot:1649707-Rhodomonas_salina.1